jgi:hypothetical protein
MLSEPEHQFIDVFDSELNRQVALSAQRLNATIVGSHGFYRHCSAAICEL